MHRMEFLSLATVGVDLQKLSSKLHWTPLYKGNFIVLKNKSELIT